ncbi:MAG: SUF system NifU family Fe-S cluster assembly protein [Gammaproteobacteria bacterium]
MSDLRDLYQEVIFDHNRNPRNSRRMEDANQQAEGNNPLCGDEIKVYLKLNGGRIEDVSFQAHGCAISTASASLMTEAVKGKSMEEAEALFDDFHRMATGESDPSERLGKLAVLEGVREYPARVKCATLAWHTLHAALTGSEETVTTE